ncbi:YdbH domain-containing protein [Nibricoccus sp. IMCC34717]|uniref:intermembrane phospholipid transport protein YdbH family protein n=1 Tax=Nibricoccus sp. IMCC34717 TaxID=3034021 RepID=UPI00384A6AF7
MRWLKTLLAGFGALVLVTALVAWFARRPLAAWAVHAGGGAAGVEIQAVNIRAVNTNGMSATGIEARWQGQHVQIDSIDIPVASLLPPRLGQIQLKGLRATVDPATLLAKPTGGDTPSPAPATPAVDLRDWLSVARGVSADAEVRIGDSTTPLLSFDASFTTDGQALKGAVDARSGLSSARNQVSWSVERPRLELNAARAELHLADLLDQARTVFPKELAPFAASGVVETQLSGALENGTVRVSGTTRFQNLGLRANDLGVVVDGIYGEWDWINLATATSSAAQRLKVARIEAGKAVVTDLELVGSLTSANRLQVDALSAQVFGGTVRLGSSEFQLSPLSLSLTISVENIDLAQLAQILPPMNAKVTGRVDGTLRLSRANNRWAIQGGRLSLRRDSDATLRVNMPGLITGGMTPSGPSYDILRKVEEGFLNLRIDSLDAEFSPALSETERSALITITGHPLSDQVKAPVSFDVTVRGDLTRLLSFGLRDDLSLSTKP